MLEVLEVVVMLRAAHVIQYVAFGLVAAFTALGGLFVAGYAFEDPGGLAAAGLVALWLVPLAVLTFVAYRWPSAAVWVLVGAFAVLAVAWAWYAVDTTAWRSFMDDVGPVLGIAGFVLLLPLATLGRRRPGTAGLVLVALAVLPYLVFVAEVSGEPWRGPGASLTTSSTVASAPTLVVAMLFLLAALLLRLAAPGPPVEPSAGVGGPAADQDQGSAGGVVSGR